MDAVKIEVESGDDDGRDELKGAIESLPAGPGFQGDWRVAGRIVHVTAATVLDQEHGTFVIGALVEVHGLMRADGSIDATRIELKSSLGGPGEDGQKGTVKGAIQSLPSSAGLIGDWTAIAVLAFGVQGLWFGLVELVAGPGTDSGGLLGRVSEVVFVPFEGRRPSVGGVAALLGLLWGVKRALDARAEFLGRR